MTIDTSALRTFQQVWAPVVQSIPAVLEMVERQADLDRALQAKNLEIEKAQQEIDAAYAEANKRLKAVNDEMTAVIDRKKQVQDEIDVAQAKAGKEAAEVEQQKQATLSGLQAQIVAEQAKLQGLQAEYSAKRDAAQAAHDEAVRGMNAEIADLQHRKAIAQAALDAIKAKLG